MTVFSDFIICNNDDIAINVYDKYIVVDTDTSCTTQMTDGKREVTLITCTNANDEHRVIVKAREKV